MREAEPSAQSACPGPANGQGHAEDLGLPEPFRIGAFEGSVSEWLQRCRWQFDTIVDGHIVVEGRPVFCHGDRESAFWHLVTSSRGDGARELNPRRCEIVGQVWELLERFADGDPRVKAWRQKHRDGTNAIAVAPPDFSLVVALRRCRSTMLLVTAYPVTRLGRRARLAERALLEVAA